MKHEEADKSNDKLAKKRESWRKKPMRVQGPQTDDEALSDGEQHEHGCLMCNTRLNDRHGKLDKNYYLCYPKYKTWRSK